MKARRVHSFEPQAHLIDVMKKTLELNQIDNVTLHHAVAGAKLGKAHLKRTHVENSGMAEFRPGAGDLPVDMLPVDDVVGEEHVTGVKIDVEGMQMPVLRGMSKTIRRCAPVLWLELRPAKGEIEQPSEWLAKRGYRRQQISFRDFYSFQRRQRDVTARRNEGGACRGQAGAARCCQRAKCFGLTVRKVVLADAFAVNICGAAMQSAAKGIRIPQVHFDHFHAQLVHLLCLIDFRLFDTNGFRI